MQKKKINKFFIPISIILLIIFFILSQAINSKTFIHLFWASFFINTVCVICDINFWSQVGLNVDKEKSKSILSGFGDSTTLLVVFYALVILLVILFDTFDDNVMKNNYVIIGMFVLALVFTLFSYMLVYSAKNDTAKLLSNNKNKK